MSDITYHKKGLRAAAIYGAVALLIALFGIIYTHFGHGVTSPYMSFAFLFPLGGACLYLLFAFVKGIPYPTLTASRCAAYSLTVFTLDFILQGVLDIAGAFADSMAILPYVACGFATAAVVVYLDSLFPTKETKETKQ